MIPILMYHQVADLPAELDPLGLAMPPQKFEQQMNYLARTGCQCLRLPEAVEVIKARKNEPKKSFVLTFDDGYQNVLTTAAPIMEKFGFTATVFLVASQIGTKSDWWGQNDAFSGQLMSRAEALEFAQRGHLLGSHSLNHRFLNILDEETAYEEVYTSKEVIESTLEMKVNYFSYPYSETNSCIRHLVEKAGYTAACAGDCGPFGIFNLWRTPCLKSDSMWVFAAKANGLYNYRTLVRESTPVLALRRGVRKVKKTLKIGPVHRPDYLEKDPIARSGRGS